MEKHLLPYESLTFGRLLGRGQFGSVYKGTYEGVAVAIKKLTHQGEEKTQWAEDLYLQREIEILHSLRHAHVLRFKGICLQADTLYIVTEFAEGGDLRVFLKNNAPSWPERIRIAIQIAQAIDYLHSRNIVHRDIKTENVLMDGSACVKLCDFGFAREVDSKSPNNSTFCGSEFFEAPEIMFCMDYDERIDIFSYGMVLCELISRKQPSTVVFRRTVPGFGIASDEIKKFVEEGCPDVLVTTACECCNDDAEKRPELMLAVTELKVAYRDLTGSEYLDVKTPEQIKMAEEEEERRRLLYEEAEEEERLEEEARRRKEEEENGKKEGEEKGQPEQELEEKEKEREFERKDSADSPSIEVNSKAVVSFNSIRVKNRESIVKINPSMFEKPQHPPIQDTSKSSSPGKPTISLPQPILDDANRASFEKRPFSRSFSKDDTPEIIRIGRQLLSEKYMPTTKEEHERWSKFVVGFTKAVPVLDRQIRVFGRIRIYRKCFTSDDVLECIYNLEPQVRSKKQAHELADLLVKLSFFFPIMGGNSFKERGGMYRFHSDEVSARGSSSNAPAAASSPSSFSSFSALLASSSSASSPSSPSSAAAMQRKNSKSPKNTLGTFKLKP